MATDPTWDFQNPASKTRLLGVLGAEIDEMFKLAAEPAHWHTPTACPGWEIRDMVGHLIDATESYLTGFDIARHGGAAPEPVGVAGMAKASDQAARAFRSVPRDELLARLRDAVSLPVIASGGAGNAQHIAAALEVSQAALLASILHERPARLVTLREELRDLGVNLRDAA